ncbi:MAG: phosphopantetheine-binding protein [Bacteroidales bacterium]|nr:phosphopantetheine-binding protein [Bacteroidales bacterium]
MEKLIKKLEEILETENLDVNKKFQDYEEWDSLAALSVISLLDSDYGLPMKYKDLIAFESIKAFCEDVLCRQ